MEEVDLLKLLNKTKIDSNKFYKDFCSLKPDNKKTEEIIAKTWDFIEKNIVSKDLLYLSLLVNKNFDLLRECINWDKKNFQFSIKDPCLLFDYTVLFKNHWFHELFNNISLAKDTFKKPLYDKVLFLQLINIINDNENFNMVLLNEKLNSIDCTSIQGFWKFCYEELKLVLKVVQLCKNHLETYDELEILQYACANSLLEVFSKYLDLSNCCTDIRQFFIDSIASKIPHNEDLSKQFNTLSSFSILNDFFKLIFPTEELNNGVNVNELISCIQNNLLNITEPSLQMDLLEVIFASCFIKKNQIFLYNSNTNNHNIQEAFKLNEKEIRIVLFILKLVVDKIKMKNIYDAREMTRLNNLHKNVADAAWRLDLIVNLKSTKCETKLLYYMLADQEPLINICLKLGDFKRASEVLKIFNLADTSLAGEVLFAELLVDLKNALKKATKLRQLKQANPDISISDNLQFDEIVDDFFRRQSLKFSKENDEIINKNVDKYPFLIHFISDNDRFINILDLAITQTEVSGDSRALLHLAQKYESPNVKAMDSVLSSFTRNLMIVFDEVGIPDSLSLSNILLDTDILLDYGQHKRKEDFYTILGKLYTDFFKSIEIDQEGTLKKDHSSHEIALNISEHCSSYIGKGDKPPDSIKYLQKLFNYLKAFSKVLYIEADSSALVSKGKNTSFFELLNYNRSELMGKLLFQQNLDPNEFEKYFKKLKLDFLYHVTGNCFPTINLYMEDTVAQEELYHENVLYSPNKAVISYILKRNRLLALILNEMYQVKGVEVDVTETRIQNFLNYLRLPGINNLKVMFNNSEIITALQNEISYQKVHDYVISEMAKHDLMSSSQPSQNFEAAEEIFEDGVITVWKRLVDLIDSVPERQIKKEKAFTSLKDMLLERLVIDGFECEYYKNMLHISDRELRITLLLDNMKTWPEDFCIACIKNEISMFDVVEDERIAEMEIWLKHIEHSKKVMHVLDVPTWSDMYNMCAFQPNEVVNKLLASKEIDLLVEFIEIHEVSNQMLVTIDEQFLQKAFELEIDLTSINKLLTILPRDHCTNVCKRLIDVLKKANHLQFVVEYLTKTTEDKCLNNISLSLKILSVFPTNEDIQCFLCLLKEPLNIIEVLIMNTKLDRLAAVLNVVTPLIPPSAFSEGIVSVENINELLRRYADKSLDFRIITQPSPKMKTSELKILQSLDSMSIDLHPKAFIMSDEVPTKENWVNNTDVTECMCCMIVSFSMFNRRHHCRRCGRVVCGSCSKKRMIVPNYGDILVRVCSDCYDQTFKDKALSEDKSSWSMLDDFWMLTDDPEHNRIVREEFSYEFAPSVSLFLSLMKFHSKCDDYFKFFLDKCMDLLKLLIPSKELIPEIDYSLVIRMLKSLAVGVKMTSQDTNIQYGLTTADTILNQAELLELLAERGCLHLLPMTGVHEFIDGISLRRLTDKLLEMEQWNLALEVSTKAGLNNSGVFMAWGKSCLKAGCLSMAREKFSKCLEKTAHNTNRKLMRNSPLLNDIIKTLESRKDALDDDVVQTVDRQKLSGSTNTLNQSASFALQPESPVFIINKLKKLKHIERGYYFVKNSKETKMLTPRIEEIIFQECIYYLSKYGDVITLVDFYLKYKQYQNLVKYIADNRLGDEVFIHVYMKCLKEGSVDVLQLHMSEVDSSLNVWKDYLIKLCFQLEKQGMLNSLYQLQQYMGDFIRAAMTCIRFYEQNATSFSDLTTNKHFLKKCEEHMKQALEQEQWVDVSTVETDQSQLSFEERSITNPLIIKKMSQKDIERNTNTIQMQYEITTFLANCESNGTASPMQVYLDIYPNPDNLTRDKIKIPTLFGDSNERKFLSVLCIICGQTIDEGLDLAHRITTEFKLKPIKVYNEAGKYLAQTERFEAIAEMVDCIHRNSDTSDTLVTEMCDEMLIMAVATLSKANAPEANVKRLIKLITDKAIKISACIEAKQLKTAHFLAAKYKRVVDLRRIMKEAEMLNQPSIRILCERAIQKYTQTSASNN